MKSEPKLPYCEPCNILFANSSDMLIHNQENHQSQPTLTIPPPLRPIDTVFYNEVEITKKLRPIAKKTPITKIIPKVAKTITTKSRQLYTVIRPLAPKTDHPETPLVIKSSSSQKTALEQIMTSQVNTLNIYNYQKINFNFPTASTELSKTSQQEIENSMHSNQQLRWQPGTSARAGQL